MVRMRRISTDHTEKTVLLASQRMEPLRLGDLLDNGPGVAHFAHGAEIARLVGELEMRGGPASAALRARMHGRVKHSRREEPSLDGIGRLASAEAVLDGV